MAFKVRYDGAAIALALLLAGILVGLGKMADAHAAVPAITGNPRVDALLAQMTLNEKLSMVAGGPEDSSTNEFESGYQPGVPRLGIPSVRYADGPPGVASKRVSTGMTANMGLAATFSRSDAYDNGVVVGRDARALGQDVVLEPNVNMHRDPLWIFAWDTYGEDPLLTGAIGAGLVRGTQSTGTMAQAKDFVGYAGGDGVVIDDQTMHEIYVKPLQDTIDAGVSSVMCGYQKINGTFNCGNSDMLNGILRDQLGFNGYVTSEWGAVHDTNFINAGLDLEDARHELLHPRVLRPQPAQERDGLGNGDGAAGHGGRRTDPGAVRPLRPPHRRVAPSDHGGAHRGERAGRPEDLRGRRGASQERRPGPSAQERDLASLAMIGPGAGQTMATGGIGERANRPRRPLGRHRRPAEAARPGGERDVRRRERHDGDTCPRFGALARRPARARSLDGVEPEHEDRPEARLHGQGWQPAPGGHVAQLERDDHRAGDRQLLDRPRRARHDRLGEHRRLDGHLGRGLLRRVRDPMGHVKAGDAGVLPTTDGLNNKRGQVTLTAGAHRIQVTQDPDVSGNPFRSA